MSIEQGCALVFRCRNGFPRLPSTIEGVPHHLRGGHEPGSAGMHRRAQSAVDTTSARPQHLAATRRPLPLIQRYCPRPLLACYCVVRPSSTICACQTVGPFLASSCPPPFATRACYFRPLFEISLGCELALTVVTFVCSRCVQCTRIVAGQEGRQWSAQVRAVSPPGPRIFCIVLVCIRML
jgi:hypothetical protein